MFVLKEMNVRFIALVALSDLSVAAKNDEENSDCVELSVGHDSKACISIYHISRFIRKIPSTA